MAQNIVLCNFFSQLFYALTFRKYCHMMDLHHQQIAAKSLNGESIEGRRKL